MVHEAPGRRGGRRRLPRPARAPGSAIGITIALAAFTHAGLLGIPVIVLGIVMMFSAHVRSRTHGEGIRGLPSRERVPPVHRGVGEGAGAVRRAARTSSPSTCRTRSSSAPPRNGRARSRGSPVKPPDTCSWYRSTVPFQYLAFSSALDGFTVATSGTLSSTPPSTSGSSGFWAVAVAGSPGAAAAAAAADPGDRLPDQRRSGGDADRLPVDDLVEVLGEAVPDRAVPPPLGHALGDPGDELLALGSRAAVAQRDQD